METYKNPSSNTEEKNENINPNPGPDKSLINGEDENNATEDDEASSIDEEDLRMMI